MGASDKESKRLSKDALEKAITRDEKSLREFDLNRFIQEIKTR